MSSSDYLTSDQAHIARLTILKSFQFLYSFGTKMDLHRVAVILFEKLCFFARISANYLTDQGVTECSGYSTAQQLIFLLYEATHAVTVLVVGSAAHILAVVDPVLFANSLITSLAHKIHNVFAVIVRAEAHLLDSLHGCHYKVEGTFLQIHLQNSTLVVELANVGLLLVTDSLVSAWEFEKLVYFIDIYIFSMFLDRLLHTLSSISILT